MNPLLYSIIEQLTEMNQRIVKRREESLHARGEHRAIRGIECDYVTVDFFQKRRKKPIGSMDLIDAMDALANDVHRFEEFDIHDADRVVVRNA